MGDMRNTVFCLENLKGRDHFGRHRRRWEDNFRMDLREIR
jgi:hypothetical protein